MSRVFEGIEKGIDIYAENGDIQVRMFSGTAAPDGLGDQSSAPIGSIYMRSGTGEFYQKVANAGNSSDWEIRPASAAVITVWRPELVGAVTNSAFAAGVRDMVASPFSDDDDGLVEADFVVGEYVIGDADGTPALFEITNVTWPNVTYANAANALAEGDTFVVKKYLPDPSGGENNAIVTQTQTTIVKMADIDFAIATGINLSNSYTLPANAVPASNDTVENAIGKLDANQRDLTTLTGLPIGSVNHGSFTGSTIPTGTTTNAALQAIETAYEETDANVDSLITLSGVIENATDLGTFTGVTIPDNSNNKQALQSLETAHETLDSSVTEIDGNVDDLITLSGVPENSTDLGTFTGDTIPDSSTNKAALQSLETAHEESDQNTDDLITLSGRPENSTDHGVMDQGEILSDNATTNALLKEADAEMTRERGKSSAAGVTAVSVIDSVLVDEVSAVTWQITIEDVATPANKRHLTVFAGHNGSAAADATAVDDSVARVLKLGANFDYTLTIDIDGAAGAQVMRLNIASTEISGVNVYAKRTETQF